MTRSYLGVSLQDIDRNLAESYKLSKPEGSLITQVAPNSPAARAGLRAGDVILEIQRHTYFRETCRIVELFKPFCTKSKYSA